MTGAPESGGGDATASPDAETNAEPTGDTYKVLGEFETADGSGVLGRNTASSGTPVGVQGSVPNTVDGYGLYTPDDARVDGSVLTRDIDTEQYGLSLAVEGTRAMYYRQSSAGDAPSIFGGHPSNGDTTGLLHGGITIAGGGYDDGSSVLPNTVSESYTTIGGGRDNTVGGIYGTIAGGTGNEVAGQSGFVGAGSGNLIQSGGGVVGGGSNNDVTGGSGTISGGFSNTAAGSAAIGGGSQNEATGYRSAVGGGNSNLASGEAAVVGGGYLNNATAEEATVGGGVINSALATNSTVGGGGSNRVESAATYGTVGGGRSNDVEASDGTVSGGEDNVVTAQSGTIGGGSDNRVEGAYGTIAGGGPSNTSDSTTTNVVYDDYGTIGGGGDNAVGTDDGNSFDEFATVSGGRSNTAGQAYSAVGGGYTNTASGSYATVGGGNGNAASGTDSTVGGGDGNDAVGNQSTIAGGSGNATSEYATTIAGGVNNYATDSYATVGGGWGNTASGDRSTVAGGQGADASGFGASVGGGENGNASGSYSTIPGGVRNEATGRASFAAGSWAHAVHEGTFVWSDYSSPGGDFTSTGTNQFLLRAAGGVGIGTNDPSTQLHVADNVSGTAQLGNHVATIENTATSGGDVLALKTGEAVADAGENFITFFDGGGTVGAIEDADGSAGLTLKSGSGDFAEYLPLADPDLDPEPGTVLGLCDGQLSDDFEGATDAFVVSETAIVLGNHEPDNEDDHVSVALVGQVPVTVDAPTSAGDRLVAVPGGRAAPVDTVGDAGPTVGRALTGAEQAGETVTVLVGLDRLLGGDTIETAETDALIEENERLRDRNARLEARLATVEAHLGLDADAAPADD